MSKRKQTVKSYLNMGSKQISKMSDKELRKATTILNSAANKRIKRVYSAGLSSAKVDKKLENGKFSIKGIESREGLQNAFLEAKQFLESSTTSVSGIKHAQEKTFKNLAKIVNKELPEDERIDVSGIKNQDLKNIAGDIWSQVDKLSENKSLGITKNERYKLAAHAYNVTTRQSRPIKTKQGLYRNLKKYYNELYQESINSKGVENMTEGESKVASIYTNIT